MPFAGSPDDWRVKPLSQPEGALMLVLQARYPALWHAPTRDDAQDATQWARAIYETFVQALVEGGLAPVEPPWAAPCIEAAFPWSDQTMLSAFIECHSDI